MDYCFGVNESILYLYYIHACNVDVQSDLGPDNTALNAPPRRQIWNSYKYINESFDSHKKWAPLFYNAKTGAMIRGPTTWENFRNFAIGVSPHTYGELPDLMQPDVDRFNTDDAVPLKLIKDTIDYGPEWTRGLPGPISAGIESLGKMGKRTVNRWGYRLRKGRKEFCQFLRRDDV